ncbi:hypothetical protein CR513_33439, partial [Mucuna pruriens]
MEEIRARAEKHIKVDQLEVERQLRASDTRPTLKGENKYLTKSRDYPLTLTPLRKRESRYYHPKDTKGRWLGANTQKWCEFQRAYGHSIKDCRGTRKPQLAQGHLGKPGEAREGRRSEERGAGRPREGTPDTGVSLEPYQEEEVVYEQREAGRERPMTFL